MRRRQARQYDEALLYSRDVLSRLSYRARGGRRAIRILEDRFFRRPTEQSGVPSDQRERPGPDARRRRLGPDRESGDFALHCSAPSGDWSLALGSSRRGALRRVAGLAFFNHSRGFRSCAAGEPLRCRPTRNRRRDRHRQEDLSRSLAGGRRQDRPRPVGNRRKIQRRRPLLAGLLDLGPRAGARLRSGARSAELDRARAPHGGAPRGAKGVCSRRTCSASLKGAPSPVGWNAPSTAQRRPRSLVSSVNQGYVFLHAGLSRPGRPILSKTSFEKPSLSCTSGTTLTTLLMRSPFSSFTVSVTKLVPIACRFSSSVIFPFGASRTVF